MSAISSLRDTIVPDQNCGCLTRVPTEYPDTSLFLGREVGIPLPPPASWPIPFEMEPTAVANEEAPWIPNQFGEYFPSFQPPEN